MSILETKGDDMVKQMSKLMIIGESGLQCGYKINDNNIIYMEDRGILLKVQSEIPMFFLNV